MELRVAPALDDFLLGVSHVGQRLEFVVLREVAEDRRKALAGLDLAVSLMARSESSSFISAFAPSMVVATRP